VTRISASFGLWAAFCAALTLVPLVPMNDLSGPAMKSVMEIVWATGVAAWLGWGMFHHQGRQPGGWEYCLLAVLVVLALHVWFFAPTIFATAQGIPSAVRSLAVLLALHAWFTVPVALLATYLFVAARRRFAKAEPSGPSPARSRS